MATEKYFCFDEQGELKRIKGRLVRFLDNEAPTGSDKSAIRTSLEVSPDAEGLVQADIGTQPNELVLHGHLSGMAYMSPDSVSVDTLEVTDKVDGSLGIDVTPTASKLEVSGTTNSSLMMTRTSSGIVSNLEDAAGYGSLLLYQAGGSAKVSIQGNGNSYFNGGSVGIGGSPTRKLELQKTGFLGSSTLGSPTDSTVSIDVRGNSSTDIVQGEVLGAYTLDAYDSSGATGGGVTQNSGMHFVAGNHFGPSASSVDLVFATGANGSTAERWRIDANTGNLVANSTGIDFGSTTTGSGTVATNGGLLADYEFGDFTMTAGGTWTVTPAAVSGKYVKVGNLVTCYVVFTGSPTKASSTSGWLQGLPFATNVYAGLGSVSDTSVADRGNCYAGNTDRLWLTGTSFGATNYATVSYRHD